MTPEQIIYDLTTRVGILQVVVIVSMALTAVLFLIPGPCQCEKCAFHVNERRVKGMQQVEFRHDYEHKGSGWRDGDPDRYDCADIKCKRNRRNVPPGTLDS